MKPRAEPDRGFFDERPPNAPFASLLRRDPFRRVFRIRDAAWGAALAAMPLDPGEPFLDVGGGNGLLADRMHALRGVRPVCVDLALRGLRAARDDGIAVRPVGADASALPFPSGVFGGVVSFETLEHISRWEDAVAELVRVTKPGRHIVVSAVSARWKWTWNWWLARVGIDVHSYADHDPSRFVEPDRLRVAFERAGAEVLESRGLNAFATLAYDEAIMLLALLFDRAPRRVAGPFLDASSLVRRVAGPPLVLSEFPWRLLARSNSVLVVARRR